MKRFFLSGLSFVTMLAAGYGITSCYQFRYQISYHLNQTFGRFSGEMVFRLGLLALCFAILISFMMTIAFLVKEEKKSGEQDKTSK